MSAPVLKLSVYIGERDRAEHHLLADRLLALLERRRVRTSVMLRGIEGFGLAHSLHTERLLTLSEDLPIVVIAVDEPARVESLLPDVRALCRSGLITLERGRSWESSDGAHAPWMGRAAQEGGEARGDEAAKLSVFLGRGERTAGGERGYLAAVHALRAHGAWGARVLLGLDGTLAGERRRARMLAGNAGVPLMVIGIAPADRAAGAAAELARIAGEGPVLLERVQVCKADGVLRERPRRPPAQDAEGRPYWQKLSVYSSERARESGQSLHAALVRALRAAGAAGATSLRAQYGFHGEQEPHGERLLSLERQGPVLTVAIDTPERTQALFERIDALSAAGGLITCELVPALRAAGAPDERGALGLADPSF